MYSVSLLVRVLAFFFTLMLVCDILVELLVCICFGSSILAEENSVCYKAV